MFTHFIFNTYAFARGGGVQLARLFVLFMLLINHVAHAAVFTADVTKVRLIEHYGRLPLTFEANQGQTDANVRYIARGTGYALFLTGDEAVLSLRAAQSNLNSAVIKPASPLNPRALVIRKGKGASAIASTSDIPSSSAASKGAVKSERAEAGRSNVVRARLLGANMNPTVKAEDLQPGHSHYLLGNDPKKWTRNVKRYRKVLYQSIYPGIDLVYYGNQQQLEYDFVVAPHADPQRIRMRYSGIESAELTNVGDIELHTTGGSVVLHKPVVYQTIGNHRKTINGSYKLLRKKLTVEVAFALGGYDRDHPLVIDPLLVYSTYLGGASSDIGQDIAVDAAGNAYVTGVTGSTDFPTLSPLQDSLKGSNDVFVTKLAPDGQSLIYSTYLGGTDSDEGSGIVVDGSGQAYVTGITLSGDFPMQSPLQVALAGGLDVFVFKLSADGRNLIYSTYLGGASNDYGSSIALDTAGSVYIAGTTISTDLPLQSPLQAAIKGDVDAFVAKLAPDGRNLIYSTYLGGSEFDFLESGTGIAVDPAGHAYIIGFTDAHDFPVKNALQGVINKGTGAEVFVIDAFITKLAVDGQSMVYSTYLGGGGEISAGDDAASGIAVDAAGQAYVTGYTDSFDFPLRSPLQGTLKGSDAFLSKLTTDGQTLVYSTFLGGTSLEGGEDIALDANGQMYVAGFTTSTDFPTHKALQGTLKGSKDVFVAKITADGQNFVYGTYLGGSNLDFSEMASGIAVDGAGNAYIAGGTTALDFPTQSPLQPLHAGGEWDAFITKIGTASSVPSQLSFSASKYFVQEEKSEFSIRVNRTNNSSGAVSVNYATRDGTATAGADYQPVKGTLSWADGDSSTKSFKAPIINDTLDEPNETVTLRLSNPIGGATIGTPGKTVLKIIDND